MKTHEPWNIAWRTNRCIWCHSWNGTPKPRGTTVPAARLPLRTFDQFNAVYRQRITSALRRHLARGGKVVEIISREHRPVWFVGCDKFCQPHNTDATCIAQHITNRFLGFGWSIVLQDTEPLLGLWMQ